MARLLFFGENQSLPRVSAVTKKESGSEKCRNPTSDMITWQKGIRMQITRQVDYAIRTVLYLSQLGPGAPVPLSRIAQDMNIPPHSMAKLAHALSCANILHTRRRAGGGMILAKSPDKISLLEIVEVIDGPIRICDCVHNDAYSQQSSNCPIRKIWEEAQATLVDHLSKTNFAQLVASGQRTFTPKNLKLSLT